MLQLLKSLSLRLRYVFVQMLCWLTLKPLYLSVATINFFVAFVANAKSNIMKDIVLHELETNTKFFLTTDTKRSPCGPQVTKKADEQEEDDWMSDPAIARMMSEVDRRKANMRKEGRVGMISRTDYPDTKIKTGTSPPAPMTGYTTENEIMTTLVSMAQNLRDEDAKCLVNEIKSAAEVEIEVDTTAFDHPEDIAVFRILDEAAKYIRPKKKMSPKKKAAKKAAVKKAIVKKKASSKKR